MNNLDDQLILKILNYVDIYDLITNCRLVNKKFQKLINKIEFNELILLNQSTFNINNWFYNYDPINTRNVFPIKSDFLKFKIFKKKFKNLKSIKIDYPIENKNLSLGELNCLNNLKHLEISFVKILSKDIHLKIPNLEILSISHRIKLKFKFIIYSNDLKILKIDDLQFISIKHPKSIIHLELYQFNENVNQFKNLRILKLSKLTRSLCKIELSSLKELTLLSVYGSNLISDKIQHNFEFYHQHLSKTYFNDLIGLRKGKEIINELNKYLKIYKRDKLKIYLKGVLINRNEKFNDNSFLIFDKQDYVLHSEFSNKKLEKRLNWLNEIDYKLFINTYQMKFDFKRYFNIQIVNLIGFDEPERFLSFLSICHNLSALTLYYTSFDSKIYNRLPSITKLITQLVIFENDNIEIDYYFILEFKLLTNFYTNQQLEQELVDKMLKNLKLIRYLRYESNDDIILIEQNNLGQFSKLIDKNNLKSTNENNLNEIKFLDDSTNDSQINSKDVNKKKKKKKKKKKDVDTINSDIEIKHFDINNIQFLDTTDNLIEEIAQLKMIIIQLKEKLKQLKKRIGELKKKDKSIKDNSSINDNSPIKEDDKSIEEQIDSEIVNQVINLSLNTDNSTNECNKSISTNSDSKYDSADDDLNSISENSIDKNLKMYASKEEIDLDIKLINALKLDDKKDDQKEDYKNDQKEDNKNVQKEDNKNVQKDNNSKNEDNDEEYSVTVI